MPCYSPGMGVRGFPLIFHSLIPLVAGSVNVVTGQKVSAKPDSRKKIRLVRFAQLKITRPDVMVVSGPFSAGVRRRLKVQNNKFKLQLALSLLRNRLVCGKFHFKRTRTLINRPLPTSKNPAFKTESQKCKIFHVKTSFDNMTVAQHLHSFRKGGFGDSILNFAISPKVAEKKITLLFLLEFKKSPLVKSTFFS